MEIPSDKGPATLYDRVGGAAAVSEIVQNFYARVLADHELQPFFAKTAIDKLLRMQQEFFCAALDGPSTSSGMNLSHAHANRGITRHHFNIFCQHMLDTLRERGLAEDDIMDVVHRVSVLKNDITGEAY